MKKIFLALLALCFFIPCFATYTTEYKAPILKTSLDFHANSTNGKITTSWANIDIITKNTMKWYKVIKSTTNRFPVYPEDGYIAAISERTQTSFIETNPTNGTYYYRVCAIMEDMNRYCSNVVELTINSSKTTVKTKTSTNKDSVIATPLATNAKILIDSLVTNFMTKLDTKYGTNISSKITVLDALIAKVNTLTTGKSAALFTYFKDKLEEQTNLLRLQSLLDI